MFPKRFGLEEIAVHLASALGRSSNRRLVLRCTAWKSTDSKDAEKHVEKLGVIRAFRASHTPSSLRIPGLAGMRRDLVLLSHRQA
jgi:hypothetical protein